MKAKISFPDLGETFDANFYVINHAYLGTYGQATFAVTSSLDVGALKKKYSNQKALIQYEDNSGNASTVSVLWTTAVNVYKRGFNSFIVEVNLTGAQRRIKNLALRLVRYASSDEEAQALLQFGLVPYNSEQVKDCQRKCQDPIINTVGVALNTLTGQPFVVNWEPPSADPVVIRAFNVTLSDGSTISVPLTKEAFTQMNECVPIGNPPTAPCNAPLDKNVAKCYNCLMWYLNMTQAYYFSIDVPANVILQNGTITGADNMIIGTSVPDPWNENAVGGNIYLSWANYVYCNEQGCFHPNQVSNTEGYKTCTFPDIQWVDNSWVKLLEGISWQPITSTKSSWFSLLNVFEMGSMSGKITYTWRSYPSGSVSTTSKTYDGAYIYVKFGSNKNAVYYYITSPIHVAFAFIDMITKRAYSMVLLALKNIIFPIFNTTTFAVDLTTRVIDWLAKLGEFVGAVTSCSASRYHDCKRGCELFGRMVYYDLSKIAQKAGLSIEGLSNDEFILSMDRPEEVMQIDLSDLFAIIALENKMVVDWSNGTVNFRGLGQNTYTIASCEGIAVASGKSEFGAGQAYLRSPIISISKVLSMTANAVESGAYSLDCVPYYLVDVMKKPMRISMTSGSGDVIEADVEKASELSRFWLTHAKADLIFFRLDLNYDSLYQVATQIKPGDKINFYPDLTNMTNPIEFYVVDVAYYPNHVDILLVKKDTVANVTVS
jgi:hypothetical protein